MVKPVRETRQGLLPPLDFKEAENQRSQRVDLLRVTQPDTCWNLAWKPRLLSPCLLLFSAPAGKGCRSSVLGWEGAQAWWEASWPPLTWPHCQPLVYRPLTAALLGAGPDGLTHSTHTHTCTPLPQCVPSALVCHSLCDLGQVFFSGPGSPICTVKSLASAVSVDPHSLLPWAHPVCGSLAPSSQLSKSTG